MDKICKNCKYSLVRSAFSFRKNGSYHLAYECIRELHSDKVDTFKRLDDTCDNFIEKEEEK